MNTEFFNALEALEKEKGIPKEYMLEKVEAALVSAYKRNSGGNTNVRVLLDTDKKEVRLFCLKDIVEEVANPDTQISIEDAKKVSRKSVVGGVCEIEVKMKNFGRISAQAAKQVIIQGIREAERTIQIKEYESKKEEVITSTVVKIDPTNGAVVLDTGTSSAVLMKTEQIPGEVFEVGQHVQGVLMEVQNDVKGPIVTLSRTHFGLVKRLFELEIPEIKDGTVVIRGISREAGSRTKIAVFSRDEKVDPVGACVGNQGTRIQSIVDEINGEKIDVIEFSDVPEKFISAALKPATVNSVTIDGERSCKVIVAPDQLSLAIGKEGQNARLAARLTGFKIDIKTV